MPIHGSLVLFCGVMVLGISSACRPKDAGDGARAADILDAFESYKENKDETKLRLLIKPIEYSLQSLRSVVIRDTAVDALCHGAQLAIPGIIAIPHDLRPRELVGIYTLKGEIVGLAEAIMKSEDIETETRGFAFVMKRIIMKPNTYPKVWRSSARMEGKAPSEH